MGLFKKLFGKNWQPLICEPAAVIELFEECLRIDAPCSCLVIEQDGKKHEIGMDADYDRKKGFFDIEFYLDDQRFPSLDALCAEGRIDGTRFLELGRIKVLEDKEIGEPRNCVLLEKREIQ